MFKLFVLQTGTFDGLKAAQTQFMSSPITEADYGALTTTGNVGPWVIGSVHASPVSDVP